MKRFLPIAILALAARGHPVAATRSPARLQVLSVRADIYTTKGDTKAAKETIAAAVDYAKSLPEAAERGPHQIAREKLASM